MKRRPINKFIQCEKVCWPFIFSNFDIIAQGYFSSKKNYLQNIYSNIAILYLYFFILNILLLILALVLTTKTKIKFLFFSVSVTFVILWVFSPIRKVKASCRNTIYIWNFCRRKLYIIGLEHLLWLKLVILLYNDDN